MSRSAQSLLPPREAVYSGPDVRSPAERALLMAVWTGVVVFCLAFWAVVTLLFVA